MKVHDHDSIRQVAREAVAEIARQRVRDDQTLVSSGLIDSLSVLKLISKLEEKLQIKVPKTQVQPEDFDSVDLIMATLERVSVG